MIRLLPRSLVGQMAVLIGLALFAAQLVNFGLLLNEREKLALAQNQGPAITRFATVVGDFVEAPPEFKRAVLVDNSRRGIRFSLDSTAAVEAGAPRESSAESRVRQALAELGVAPAEIRASLAEAPRRPNARNPDRPRQSRGEHLLMISARFGSVWVNGRLPTPRADPLLATRLGFATLILYVLVLGTTLLVALRLARPLRDLTRAADAFAGRAPAVPVTPRGPGDLRRAIEAFNAMNRRVAALLDEKDRMLGAIGHDLRTPLAAARIRAEDMEPEAEREKLAETLDEMNAILEDILVLARSGQAQEEARAIDLAALVDSLVEEYRDIGADVTMAPAARLVVPAQPVLVRRALRNLIDNAVKYGGSAQVSVTRDGREARVAIADQGPGLPPAELERVLEPFYRVESSRSRETGGTGLGLAIARAIAEGHGGALRLANSDPGLIATLVLPAGDSDAA